MAPEADQLAPESESELTDEKIGPTLPRLEVQVVNTTTERDNHQRRIDSIKAELQNPGLSEQDRAEMIEDLTFSEAKLTEVQAKLDALTSDHDTAVAESTEVADQAPAPSSTVDELSSRAIEIARSVSEQSSEESYKS